MHSLKKVIHKIRKRGILNYWRVFTNCRVYGFYTRKYLPAKCFTKPIHLQVETSQLCNLTCKMCEYSISGNNGRVMRLGEFQEVLRPFPFLHSLDLTGIGEPFCNPDFLEIVKFATSKGIVTQFSTNGILLNSSYMDALIEAGVESVLFSVDASTKETYERIRYGSSFDKLIRNIAEFSSKISRSRAKKPKVCLTYTISKENASEADLFPKLAKSFGVSDILYRDLITFNQGKYSSMDRLNNTPEEMRKKIKSRILSSAQELGISVFLCESLLLESKLNRKFCYRPWTSCFIDVWGTVYPCCRVTQKNVDITKFSLGNIISGENKGFWNIPGYQALRRDLVFPGRIPSLCRGCDCLRIGEQV